MAKLNDPIDLLTKSSRRLRRSAAALLDDGPLTKALRALEKAALEVGRSWSGSALGYHARVYLKGFRPPKPGEFFHVGFPDRSVGPWLEVVPQAVRDQIERLSAVAERQTTRIEGASTEVSRTFADEKAAALPVLQALAADKDESLVAVARDARDLTHGPNASDIARAQIQQSGATSDDRALQGGLVIPPHLHIASWVKQIRSRGQACMTLAGLLDHAVAYMRTRAAASGRKPGIGGTVFIGHGRSPVWKDLRHFLQDKLGLGVEEFDSESNAGKTNIDRLKAMLQASQFAFLVMTAEDPMPDGRTRARENVVHEVGLFQGRVGFEKAIVLLEEGCAPFSNIDGLSQIRFPKNDIEARYERIRDVLTREKLI